MFFLLTRSPDFNFAVPGDATHSSNSLPVRKSWNEQQKIPEDFLNRSGDAVGRMGRQYSESSFLCVSSEKARALSNRDFGVPSFPRSRESRLRHWIPACAGMTTSGNGR
jgi:hypothetical protein